MDHVCYTKLINGALNCGKVELANSFYEKSIVDKIVLNVHVYKSLYEEIKISKIVEKNKLLSVLEKQIENFNVSVETINSSNGYLKEKNPNFIKPQEFKVNRKIPFENQENYHKSFEKNNIIEEKRNNYNKENKDNFNFRNKVESQTKTGENHDFDIRKKNRNPMLILSPKELGKMVSPKNL